MSLIISGTVTVPTETADPIVETSTPCIRVTLQNAAVDANGAVIFVGGIDSQEYPIAVGEDLEFFVRDALDVYCVSAAGGETLRYLITTG